MNTIQKFEFAKQLIDFEVENGKVMINATQMAKVFQKRVDVFLKSDHAQAFIQVLQSTPYGVNSTPLKEEEIVKKKRASWHFYAPIACPQICRLAFA